MNEDVADGMLINLRSADMASLLTEAAEPGMKTALDRLLMSSTAGCNGFSNSIE